MRTSGLSSTTRTRPVGAPAAGTGAAARPGAGGGGAGAGPLSAATRVAAEHRLAEHARRAGRGRLALELGVEGAGDDEDPDARIERVDALERLDPAEPRHHQVEHDGVGPVPLDAQQGLEPVRRLEDVEAGDAEGLDRAPPGHPRSSSTISTRMRSPSEVTSRTRRGP